MLVVAGMGAGCARAEGPLDDQRWRSRGLLLYAPAPETPSLQAFRERVRARECDVADRDRVFGRIDGMPMRRQEMADRGTEPCDQGRWRVAPRPRTDQRRAPGLRVGP